MHFSLIVLMPKVSDERINIKLESMLEPFRTAVEDDDEPPVVGTLDWWQVGGRFTGFFDGYEPTIDPANIETCTVCNGTGKRDDDLGRQQRAIDPAYACNGCGGKGDSLKWPVLWRAHAGDIAPVSSLTRPLPHCPFAVLSATGEWHELGWNPEADETEWRNKVERMLNQHNDAIVIIVDCHC